jgi:hypothetical protein
MTRSDDDGFLSRWSRRKRTGGPDPDSPPPNEEAGPQAAHATDEDAADDGGAAPAKTDAELCEELGLKDPDKLGPGDDFSGFMKAGVPEHLRRRALRKLWVSNPVLANLDGLNDYDTDFTGDTVAPGMLKTAYKVGRGIVRDLAEAEPDEDAVPGPPADEDEAAAGEAELAALAPENAKCPQTSDNAGGKRQDVQENDIIPVRRRIKFRFDR